MFPAPALDIPKPVGILACNDDRGHELLNACREVKVAVPDDVAVIGVDNDEVLCELSDPPLSSVDSNTEQTGYRAALLLDQLMAGEKVMGDELVDPLGVHSRQSTDLLAIEDPEIATVVRFIRENACSGASPCAATRLDALHESAGSYTATACPRARSSLQTPRRKCALP